MKVMDIVKPAATTELEVWTRTMNVIETKLRFLPHYEAKKIEVKQIFSCPHCGAPTEFRWECEKCADTNGGDGGDD